MYKHIEELAIKELNLINQIKHLEARIGELTDNLDALKDELVSLRAPQPGIGPAPFEGVKGQIGLSGELTLEEILGCCSEDCRGDLSEETEDEKDPLEDLSIEDLELLVFLQHFAKKLG